MRIKYYLIFLLLFPFGKLMAQIDPMTIFYPWTQPYFNPGTLGEKENHLNFIGVLHQGAEMVYGGADKSGRRFCGRGLLRV